MTERDDYSPTDANNADSVISSLPAIFATTTHFERPMQMISSRRRVIALIVGFWVGLTPSFAGLEHENWMDYLDASCSTTLSGKARRLMGERAFWASLSVAMDAWAREERLDPIAQNFCRPTFQQPSEREQLMKCLAHEQNKWDWYRRCKPIVVSLCRSAGGFC